MQAICHQSYRSGIFYIQLIGSHNILNTDGKFINRNCGIEPYRDTEFYFNSRRHAIQILKKFHPPAILVK